MSFGVICISRTTAAGGENVGDTVAQRLGFRYVDEQIIERAAQLAQVDPKLVEAAEHRRPLLQRLIDKLAAAYDLAGPVGLATGVPIDAFIPPSAGYHAVPDDLRALIRAAVHDSISTGAISVDIATGIGGVPRGRIVEIFGPESSGKTTLTLHIVAEAQKAGGTAVFIDAEHAMDPVYAKKLGVNVDELLISQPDSAEEALQIADTLIRSGAIDVLVVDSVAALAPRAELEGEMGDAHVGLQARLMSQACAN